MTKFESTEKTINAGREPVYEFLTDINNFSSLVPAEQVRDFKAGKDNCHFYIDGIGSVGVRLVDNDNGDVRFESEGSTPFRFDLLVELNEAGPGTTRMRLILNANLNMMMKMVAGKHLEQGVEFAASRLSDHLNRINL
jgi:carbon monoxide dehydrogenase subunit G